MTPTTPRQAREAAELYRDTGTTVSVKMVFSLADQVEALTKKRDSLKSAVLMLQEREKVARVDYSALRDERDTLAAAADSHKVVRDTLTARLNVLEAAAKLALDAGEKFIEKCNSGRAKSIETRDEILASNAALRQAGVQ